MTSITPSTKVIAGDEALATFRQGLTGPYALSLLAAARGGLLVQLPVGVGKSEWAVKIIVHALSSGSYDLVVVLIPRWDILKELLKRLPVGLKRVVLSPRPRQRCGELDPLWAQYEQQALGCLGRNQLCGGCPHRDGCPWPRQYGSPLRGARLIFAMQQHLVLNPAFILHLKQQARANNPLVLIDESDLLIRQADRTIRAADLNRFVAAQQACLAAADKPSATASSWLERSRLLALATTADLREGGWSFPWVDAGWAGAVQARGLELFAQDFRFPAYELHHLAHSDPCGRERLPSGDIRFTSLPYLGSRFAVFSGSMPGGLARYRLDPDHAHPALSSPFEGYRFEHPATRWYNLNSLAGAAKFFGKNAGRILDFFAALIARNIAEGKRTLLVSRKKFIPLCRQILRERLAALKVGPVKIVSGNWKNQNLKDPRVLSLINYGVAGLNRFEQVECAYCLNSYYVTPGVVSQAVQDMEASTERFPVSITSNGEPRRRRAEVELPGGRVTILPWIAQQVLQQKEGDVVVQAVGRVRPFTRPRQVITFQGDALAGVRYTAEFRSLQQARHYFNVPTPTEAGVEARASQARRLKAQGYSRAKIAKSLAVSLSTVKRYLRRPEGSQNILEI